MCVVYLWEVTTFFTTLSLLLFGHAPPVQAGIDTFPACVARHRIYVELGPLRHGVCDNVTTARTLRTEIGEAPRGGREGVRYDSS